MVGRCYLIFLGIYVLLFTTFLTNLGNPWECLDPGLTVHAGRLVSGSYGALKYWIDQHDVQRGGQPWFYYLLLLSLYEFIPLSLTLVAVWQRKFNLFGKFCLAWSIGALLIYSYRRRENALADLAPDAADDPHRVARAGSLDSGRHDRAPGDLRSCVMRLDCGWVSSPSPPSFVAIYAVQWLNVIDGQALGLERLTIIVVILGSVAGLVWLARRSHLAGRSHRTGVRAARGGHRLLHSDILARDVRARGYSEGHAHLRAIVTRTCVGDARARANRISDRPG